VIHHQQEVNLLAEKIPEAVMELQNLVLVKLVQEEEVSAHPVWLPLTPSELKESSCIACLVAFNHAVPQESTIQC